MEEDGWKVNLELMWVSWVCGEACWRDVDGVNGSTQMLYEQEDSFVQMALEC